MRSFVLGASAGRHRCVLVASLAAALGLSACGGEAAPAGEAPTEVEVEPRAELAAVPDSRLITHAFEPSTPNPAGLAYVEFVADVHERADLAKDPETQAEILADGLERAVPEGVAEAEVLHLELAARLGEVQLDLDAPQKAQRALVDLVAPSRSLPLDRASAHALTVLGDAAHHGGDDALAAGSYARAVRMMSMLADDLAERAGVADSGAPTDATDGGTP